MECNGLYIILESILENLFKKWAKGKEEPFQRKV